MSNLWYNETAVALVMLAITVSFFVDAQRVTQPTWAETTTVLLVMVTVASMFFLVADQVMHLVVTYFLGIGS